MIIHLFLLATSLTALIEFSRIPAKERTSKFENMTEGDSSKESLFLVILGTLQDGGSPHLGCKKECCKDLFLNPDPSRKVVSIGIVEPQEMKRYIIEATPDYPEQLYALSRQGDFEVKQVPDGIFISHAHIGHYTGLMFLGKEAQHSNQVPVYVMPRMKTFIEQNGPWSQLVARQNISLQKLEEQRAVQLTPNLRVTPFLVPHRDEFSETVGFLIEGPNKKALFIPDIDKWEKWSESITDIIAKVDYAFIDGTFYDGEEINYRDISEIPHPFIIESMALFRSLSLGEKNKIFFIHLNHTNPALLPDSPKTESIKNNGFHVAQTGQKFHL
jgi:pyrroloquinoline quinone biosynthesis protein B